MKILIGPFYEVLHEKWWVPKYVVKGQVFASFDFWQELTPLCHEHCYLDGDPPTHYKRLSMLKLTAERQTARKNAQYALDLLTKGIKKIQRELQILILKHIIR